MIESTEFKVRSKIAPDFAAVENSGVAFDWTWKNVVALNEDINLLIKTKQMPKNKSKISKPLLMWYWLTAIGVMMSIPIMTTLAQQYYFDAGTNLFAGLVLGSTGISVIYFAQKIYHLRKKPYGKPRFDVKSIRVGIDGDTLWIRDENLLSVLLSRSCIKKVVQIEDVIVGSIGDSASYPFPRKILEASSEGKEVIQWFEKHWPESLGSGTYRFDSIRRPWYRRVASKMLKVVSAIGILMLIFLIIPYIDKAWQEMKLDQAVTKFNQSKGLTGNSQSLSGSGATDFLYHLTHPGIR